MSGILGHSILDVLFELVGLGVFGLVGFLLWREWLRILINEQLNNFHFSKTTIFVVIVVVFLIMFSGFIPHEFNFFPETKTSNAYIDHPNKCFYYNCSPLSLQEIKCLIQNETRHSTLFYNIENSTNTLKGAFKSESTVGWFYQTEKNIYIMCNNANSCNLKSAILRDIDLGGGLVEVRGVLWNYQTDGNIRDKYNLNCTG